MRRPERIPKFLELVDHKKLLIDNWKICNKDSEKQTTDFNAILLTIKIFEDKIKSYWNEHPDLRYSQVLVNLGTIPNFPGYWYYDEESDILNAQGLPLQECLMWGANYDKDMNRLPATVYRYINELETDHIQAILDGQWTGNSEYIKAFTDELNRRKEA